MRPSDPPPSNVFETLDASADLNTDYLLGVGRSFYGRLDSGDTDWIAVKLYAGGTFNFELVGTGIDNLPDASAHLQLYSYNGTPLALDDTGGDDGDAIHADIWHRADYTGIYFLEVSSTKTGTYAISTEYSSDGMPPFIVDVDTMVGQLTNDYWQSTGEPNRNYDVPAGATLSVNITGLTAEGQFLATKALDTWTAFTGIAFNFITAEDAHIVFDDEETGAFANSVRDVDSPTHIINSTVNVSTDWLAGSGTTVDSYSFQTYLHEVGHALGLGHAGNYNGTGTFGTDNRFANDSWQISLMSYFDQETNTAVDAEFAYTITPMLADIIAIQQMYGTTGTLRDGDTVYGVGSTAGAAYDDIMSLVNPVAFTLLDDGGIDTVDMSTVDVDQRFDLRAEHFSDTLGLVGNMGIARGTVIENVISGSGDDLLRGNSAGNLLSAGRGADILIGANGKDTLRGGKGNDDLQGGNGKDRIDGGRGNDLLSGGAQADIFIFKDKYGKDTITDFEDNKDTIRLDDALWAGHGILTTQQVVDAFATVSGGDITLDFGIQELTIRNFANLAELANDLVIV